MNFQWFNSRQATDIGAALAIQVAPFLATESAREGKAASGKGDKALAEIIRRGADEVLSLRLNIYKRAKFANSFKWGLLDRGVAAAAADQMTEFFLMHLSRKGPNASTDQHPASKTSKSVNAGNLKQLFLRGNKCFAQGEYDEAITFYQQLIAIQPDHADGLTNLGAAFCKVGRYKEGAHFLRQAIDIQPDSPDALSNLGILLLWMGELVDAENLLRRAIKLKPRHVDAQINLGLTFAQLGRSREARARFQKALKMAPRSAEATYGIGQVARLEGRFEEAEAMFTRALELRPKMPGPLAALAGIRKMQSSDLAWLNRAELLAGSGLVPLEEADLRFALGKYWDDVGDFARAFEHYKRANELQKSLAEPYDRKARTRFVNDFKNVYTRENLSRQVGSSDSTRPVFVVGMMRSGTSLVEQIVASHPAVAGAGELGFWSNAVRANETTAMIGSLGEPVIKELADEYLRTLHEKFPDALRVVDKAPVNCDYLGIIHSVFPNARIIYMRRNPIDTCLSCYFQQLLPSHDYAMDLSDLAHYYREHHRLMTHWLSVLPPGTVLEVPYEQLVVGQEAWTRKVLDFLDLEWDARCLQFHETKRQVATASYWQVRQKMFADSVERWRNYEKFIGPLRGLAALNPQQQ
jgi:tetratricopeptide (TPR) repeat protein